jgi:hypothetical protein
MEHGVLFYEFCAALGGRGRVYTAKATRCEG